MTSVRYISKCELTKDTPKLTLTGDLLSVFCEYLHEKLSCCVKMVLDWNFFAILWYIHTYFTFSWLLLLSEYRVFLDYSSLYIYPAGPSECLQTWWEFQTKIVCVVKCLYQVNSKHWIVSSSRWGNSFVFAGIRVSLCLIYHIGHSEMVVLWERSADIYIINSAEDWEDWFCSQTGNS